MSSSSFELIPAPSGALRRALLVARSLRSVLARYLATAPGTRGFAFIVPRCFEVDDLLRRLAIEGEAVVEELGHALTHHLARSLGATGPVDQWSQQIAAELHPLKDFVERAYRYAVAGAAEQESLCAIAANGDEVELLEIDERPEIEAEDAPDLSVEAVEEPAAPAWGWEELGTLREENAWLKRELAVLAAMADRDPLTGLGNARHLEHRLSEELSRARRQSSLGLALLAIRICDYHQVVAEEGPAVGDELVRWVGSFLLRNLRDYDICCRTEPDLFMVILPQTEEACARLVCDRLLRQLAAGERPWRRAVDLAVGAAGFPEDGATGDVLVARSLAEIGHAPDAPSSGGQDAQQTVRVWFPGLPEPIRAKAVVTDHGLRLRTALSFLRLNTPIDLSLGDGTSAVQTGFLRGVAVAASDRNPVPWLHVEVALP